MWEEEEEEKEGGGRQQREQALAPLSPDLIKERKPPTETTDLRQLPLQHCSDFVAPHVRILGRTCYGIMSAYHLPLCVCVCQREREREREREYIRNDILSQGVPGVCMLG